MGQRAVRH
jgi:ABC-type Co2+ transport system permease subunit